METNARIELAYPPDFGDVREAVRVRLRATFWWRLLRWTSWGGGVLAFLVAGLALVPPSPEPGTTALMVALGLVAVGCAESLPWVTAQSLFRLIRAQGDATAVVDEDGARWASRDTETTIRWALLPRYVETPGSSSCSPASSPAPASPTCPSTVSRTPPTPTGSGRSWTGTSARREPGHQQGMRRRRGPHRKRPVRAPSSVRSAHFSAHSAHVPKISTVCATFTKPCSEAIVSAHCSTIGPSTSTALPQTRQTRWWWWSPVEQRR